jgi:hypothetical protein
MVFRLKNIFLHSLAMLAFLLASGAGSAQTCSGETLKSLVFEDVQIRFVKDRGNAYVETIGILRNTGEEKANDILLVTRHLDVEGRLIDVQRDFLYSISLAPGEDLAFRFREIAAHPQSAYASSVTRVMSANCEYKQVVPTHSSGKTSGSAVDTLWESLANWWPILLLIAALFIVTRKYSGTRSPVVQNQERQFKLVERQIELIERQIALLERQGEWTRRNNALFERIAQALEERNKT